MLHAVIMAGGSGTRFWPQSRRTTPKQLLCLAGEGTMLQQTAERCHPWIAAERTWVVTNAVQAAAVREQLPQLPAENTLVEPAARNTAPCIGLAAMRLLHEDPEAVMLVMPADHVIRPAEKFLTAAQQAAELVSQQPDRLVLFGVTPTFPATGYGYIERGSLVESAAAPVFEVTSFREKPAREVAEDYLRSGEYFWNCGIFCWRARTIVDQLAEHQPELADRLHRIADALGTDSEQQVLDDQFPRMKGISIDYAVLERARQVCMVEAPFEWDDVGSWLALPRLNGADADGNTADGQVCLLDSRDCIVRSSNDHLVATLGVHDLIIVHTADATLVADAAQSERIRDLLEKLQSEDRTAWL